MTTTEIATQEAKEKSLAVFEDNSEDAIDVRDLILPKVLLMQPTSTFVQEEKAKLGEWRGSLENNLIAPRDGTAEFIAFNVFKTRITFRNVKGKQEYVGQVPWLPEHEGADRMEIIDGIEHNHFETLNFYAMLAADIKKGEAYPILLSFRSTGYMAGKALQTFRAQMKLAGKKLHQRVFLLGSKQTKNEKGTFYVPTIAKGRDPSDDELAAIEPWRELLSKTKVRIDDSDLEKDGTATAIVNEADTSGMNTNF